MSFQILQTLDLLFTHSRIIDFENIDGSLFFKTVFVYTHDRLFTRVDTCLRISLFLNINLSITSDTSRKIGWQSDSLVKSVGVQRLGMPQSSPHSLDTSTTHIIERILFGQ